MAIYNAGMGQFRSTYGTYANETPVKTIVTFSRWYWSGFLPMIIETYYEAYSGTGYARYIVQGHTKDGGGVSLVTLESTQSDTLSVASTSSDGGGASPHYTTFYITSGEYRRGTYRIWYRADFLMATESLAKAATDGFYIHA